MKPLIGNYLVNKMLKAFDDSYDAFNEIVRSHVSSVSQQEFKILDVGGGSGSETKKYLNGIESIQITSLDIVPPSELPATEFIEFNLEGNPFPLGDDMFDIVISGQTIEHLLDKDTMLSESYRVLKPGGLFVCATENIASIDNIISLVLGQEPLTQNTGSKLNTNSFLSPNFMQVTGPDGNKYLHKNVTSYFGLRRLCEVNGFKNVKIKSYGNIAKPVEKLLPMYNRIIIAYTTK